MHYPPFFIKLGLKLLLGLVFAALFASRFKREDKEVKWRLRGWADSNGFRILHSEEVFFIPNNHRRFRVEVRDIHGKSRRALIRVGSLFRGLRNPRVKVKWEDD